MIKRKVKVCESASSILVKVKRYGNIDASSFISVSVKKQSATLGDDFRISSAQQLQFDPSKLLIKKIFFFKKYIVKLLTI